MAGIAHRRWHKTPYRRTSPTWCVSTCQVRCTWESHQRPPGKSWWEDPALCTERFTRNEFLASVFEHWEDKDEPGGSHLPTWGDLYRPTQPHHKPQPGANGGQNVQDRVMTRKGDGCDTSVPN